MAQHDRDSLAATSAGACRRGVLAEASSLLLCAADRADPNPDASVEIEEVRIGIGILGGSIGGGRLHYRSREYPFSVTGLGPGGFGASTVRARGEVFGLRALDDFPGLYTETQATAAAGQAPLQVRWLRNARGVEIRLRSVRTGVMIEVSASGVAIDLDQRDGEGR